MDPSIPTFADVEHAARRIAETKLAACTPVLRSDALDDAAGSTVFVKAEALQTTGSFKIRGATNRLARLMPEQINAGVVAFSSGNHAQGVARAAKHFRVPAVIVMPADAPTVKRDGVISDGAEVVAYDRDTESREAIAARIAQERGAIVVPSFDDPDIIAGQGTAGLEFAEQVAAQGPPLDHLICCTGGGGLISGIALAFEGLSKGTKIWAAEPLGHEDWTRSLASGEIVENAVGTRSICDAILTPKPGDLTWAIGQSRLAGGLVVTDDDIRRAIRFAAKTLKIVLEPGGAAALAVAVRGLPEAMQGSRVGIVATGGNIDPAQLAEILSTA